jgi:hypothetical protein
MKDNREWDLPDYELARTALRMLLEHEEKSLSELTDNERKIIPTLEPTLKQRIKQIRELIED